MEYTNGQSSKGVGVTPMVVSGDATRSEKREWVPICEDARLMPRLGMKFQTIEECHEFYKSYAHSVGFGVRSSSVSKNNKATKTWKYFVCAKQGFRKPLIKTPQSVAISQALVIAQKGKSVVWSKKKNRIAKTREGCNAYIRLTSCDDGGYMITAFHEAHVHPLVIPRRTQFITSLREVKSMHKHLVCSSGKVNIGPSKVYDITSSIVGGHQNVGCTKKDIQNYQRDLKALIKDSDAHMLIDILKKKEMELGFYYGYEVDEENRLKRVFWSYTLSRLDYSIFGDLLSFDTTHGTNKYSMVFASFTGVNNHRQLVCFGATLLEDEKTDTFMWLFKQFLIAMGGKQPTTIITDQDLAMESAIADVFELSIHQYCMWHIMRKVPEKLGPHVNKSEEFQDRLKSCVWISETPEEFEAGWKGLLSDFGLVSNEWLCQIYEIRKDWV